MSVARLTSLEGSDQAAWQNWIHHPDLDEWKPLSEPHPHFMQLKTWSEILSLRQQKIRKQRELIKMQKKERLQKQMQIQETLKQVSLAVAIAVGVVVCVFVGFITFARGAET